MSTELTVGQEENVLALLCFSEKHHNKVREQVPVDLFSTRVFRVLAEAAVKHIEKFGKPPGVHLKDILEKRIKKSGDEGELLESVIDNMLAMRSVMQDDFMQDQLDAFVRKREITVKIEKAHELAAQDKLDEAEELLQSSSTGAKKDDGIWSNDPAGMLDFMNVVEGDTFSIGVPELDARGVMPARGTTFLFVAPPKRGKSWFLISAAKSNMLLGRSVLHVTMENSSRLTAKRYVQAWFAYASRDAGELEIPRYVREKGTQDLVEVKFEHFTPIAIEEKERGNLNRKLNRLKRRPRLHIKSFPSGALSVASLRAYLHHLAREHNYKPDVVVLDYMDLMKLGHKDRREGLIQLSVDLRGLADEEDFALVTATQGTRGSMSAQLVGSDMVSEDISKVATADTIVTYSQTAAERKYGFARLFVANARDAADQYIVQIIQNYAIGQFCLDSIYFSNDVEQITNPLVGNRKKKDTDDD